MTNDFTAIGMISANAAKVLETTRRAWNEASAQAPKKATQRPPRVTQPKKRVVRGVRAGRRSSPR